jgi:PAS domain S-box-containing protein
MTRAVNGEGALLHEERARSMKTRGRRARYGPVVDVSPRAVRQLVEASEAVLGVPAAAILGPAGIDAATLDDDARRVPWTTFASALEAASAFVHHDRERLRELGDALPRTPSSALLRVLARGLGSPMMLYTLATGYAAPVLFPGLRVTAEELPGGRVRIDAELPLTARPCVAFFHVCEGAVRSTGMLVGEPRATLARADTDGRRAVMVLAHARSSSLRRRLGAKLRAILGAPRMLDALERERHAVEESFGELSRSGEEFRALLERLPDMVVVHRDGEIAWTNRLLVTTLGYDGVDLAGRSLFDLVHPAAHDVLVDRLKRPPVPRGLPATTEMDLVRRDGEPVRVEVAPAQEVTFGGQRARLVVARDVSERTRLAQRLVTADRLASLGLLAAGVAHEINNPLAYALGSLDIADRLLASPDVDRERVRATLATAREGLGRVRTIVRDLRHLARADDAEVEAVDVVESLESTLALAKAAIGERARVVRDLRPVPPALASPARLGQVLLNLVVNAVEAMSDGDSTSHELRVRTFPGERGEIIIEVEDTGEGIAPEHLPRVFDPFFTTKPAGRGTGLGLSISHQIVASLGGEISASSVPGRGTTFRVKLTSADAAAPRARGDEPPSASLPYSRILVVDDERALLEVVREMLPEHFVEIAHGPDEADHHLTHGDWDAVLCDVSMPGRGGLDIHARLLGTDSAVAARFVFMSGGALDADTRARLGRLDRPVLEKPFDGASLARALQRTVEAARGGTR